METLSQVTGPQTYNSRCERPNPDFQHLIYVYLVAGDAILSGEHFVNERIKNRAGQRDGYHARSYGIRVSDESGRSLTAKEICKNLSDFYAYARKYPHLTFWVHDFSGLNGFDYLAATIKSFADDAPTNCYIPVSWANKSEDR